MTSRLIHRNRTSADTTGRPDKSVVESHTVKQIRIAFEETPIKLRIAEQGWKERRKIALEHREVKGRSGAECTKIKEPDVGRGKQRLGEDGLVGQGLLASPTPPHTPPHKRYPIEPLVRPKLPEDLKGDGLPRPILAFPLPATSSPISLARDVHLSIPCPTSGKHELVLHLQDRQISVLRGGEILETGGIRLHRAEYGMWCPDGRKQWDMVWSLVERIKRKTPRVRIYHPMALITITCSTPPDIIITFSLDSTPISPSHVDSLHERGYKSTSVRHIKLVYSSAIKRLTIDTSTPAKYPAPTFRTRRCIPVTPARLDDMNRVGRQAASVELGIQVGDDWLREEVEAVNRFWSLKGEWARFIGNT